MGVKELLLKIPKTMNKLGLDKVESAITKGVSAGKTAAPRMRRKFDNFANNKWADRLTVINDDGFNKKGWAAVGLISAAGMVSTTKDEIDKRDMGTTDGSVYRATPSYRSYLQQNGRGGGGYPPGGADGSLVFALHNNRRGGYL